MDQPNPDRAKAAEDLAVDFVGRREAGEEVDERAFAERLPEEERASFHEMVADARAARGQLPAQIGPGSTLADRYRIVREIGAGGMGKVFEAEDVRLGRRVAIKVLAALQTGEFDPQAQFTNESQVLAGLQHPNIVAVHEAGTDGDVHYLVMDLVEGTALTDVLASVCGADAGPSGAAPTRLDGERLERAIGLPLREGHRSIIDLTSWYRSVAKVMVEVTRTIEAAHGRSVIHRDIKPGNILLRGGGSPVVLDFGLAGHLDQRAGAITRGLFGTVAYIAPEQARASRVGADLRTDVYQLGLVLYELLTRSRAFGGEGVTEILQSISVGKFPLPRELDPAIPRDLEAICLKAMELNPDARYQTARALREDLERYLSGLEAPHAARGGAVARLARNSRYRLRRHKLAAASVLALAAGAVLAGALIKPAPLQPDPVIGAYRIDAADRTQRLPPGGSVYLHDIVGVQIQAEEPLYVYALSVWGESEPPTWVRPMRPEHLSTDDIPSPDELPSVAKPAADIWGIPVRAGRTRINCIEVVEADPDQTPYEGLWIFTSREPQPRLAEWMNSLETLVTRNAGGFADEVNAGVRYERALAELDAPSHPTVPQHLALIAGVTRGGAPTMTTERRRRALDELAARQILGDSDWPLDDPTRSVFLFRVSDD